MPSKLWDEITDPFPKLSGTTVEVWEWINNFIPYFTGHMITYPCHTFCRLLSRPTPRMTVILPMPIIKAAVS